MTEDTTEWTDEREQTTIGVEKRPLRDVELAEIERRRDDL